MGKAQDLLEKLGGKKVREAGDDKDDKDKDLVPINEPEPGKDDKEDDFSDIHVDDDDKKEEDKPDEFTLSVLKVMKHGEDPDKDFDPEQLTAGAAVEKEHTSNKWIAAAIAKAHLSEFPTYYVALAKMEADLKAEKEKGDKKEEPEKKEPDEPKKEKEDENDI
jgi:hypothetical protein